MSDIERFVRFCESEFGSAVMDREAAYVSQHIGSDDRVLDVGCGIGSLEARLAGDDVVGIDRSEPMVRAARRREAVPVLVGDACELPVRTDSVDAVVFVATLEFIPDADAALQEATRVLRPDGTFVGLLLNTRSTYVRSQLERADSYFQRMVHRDSEALAEQVLETIDGRMEYVLGIEDETVVERTDPTTAAITAVVGTPIAQSQRP